MLDFTQQRRRPFQCHNGLLHNGPRSNQTHVRYTKKYKLTKERACHLSREINDTSSDSGTEENNFYDLSQYRHGKTSENATLEFCIMELLRKADVIL